MKNLYCSFNSNSHSFSKQFIFEHAPESAKVGGAASDGEPSSMSADQYKKDTKLDDRLQLLSRLMSLDHEGEDPMSVAKDYASALFYKKNPEANVRFVSENNIDRTNPLYESLMANLRQNLGLKGSLETKFAPDAIDRFVVLQVALTVPAATYEESVILAHGLAKISEGIDPTNYVKVEGNEVIFTTPVRLAMTEDNRILKVF